MRDETQAPEAPAAPQRKLIPANENPWYVLMTLYGEPRGIAEDNEIYWKNRKAWNAWAGAGLTQSQREVVAEASVVKISELTGWAELRWEVEEKFKSEFLKRNESVGEAPRLPSPREEMNLALLDFEKNFLARGYVFPHQVLFCPSSFKREADFVNAVFVGPGQFSGSEFKEHARFENAVFLQAAHFSEATFCDRARFDWTEFRNGAGFGDARFLFEACFRYAEFLQSARFHKSIFKNLTWFTGAEFRSTTPKYELNFIFAECRFEKPVSFQDAEFRDSYPVFIGTEWPERVTFTARNWPPGQEERFEAERRFLWPISTEQHPETARDSCATIRHLLAKQGLPEDEHFFFRREMHFAGRIGPIWQRLPYLMFGWFSEYGYSIARPFWWLFAIWLFGTFV